MYLFWSFGDLSFVQETFYFSLRPTKVIKLKGSAHSNLAVYIKGH